MQSLFFFTFKFFFITLSATLQKYHETYLRETGCLINLKKYNNNNKKFVNNLYYKEKQHFFFMRYKINSIFDFKPNLRMKNTEKNKQILNFIYLMHIFFLNKQIT